MKILKLFFRTMALYILVLSTNTNAQTQTIRTLKMDDRTNPTTYNPDALIDMQSNSKGLLLPRVELTGTASAAPLANHAQGMVVYNTVSAGSGGTAVSPGYYYNDGTQWVRLGASTGSGWALTGNTGITANNTTYGSSLSAGTGNWLGTINSADLILAANNKEGLRVNNSQQVLIGTTTVPTGGTTAKVIIDNGTTNGPLQIKDGTQGVGKVLTSDANGVAKWVSGIALTAHDVTAARVRNTVYTNNTGKTVFLQLSVDLVENADILRVMDGSGGYPGTTQLASRALYGASVTSTAYAFLVLKPGQKWYYTDNNNNCFPFSVIETY